MSQPYLNGRKISRSQKIANFSVWQRSTLRSGISLQKQPEAWMPGHKKCSIHLSVASFPLQGLWEPREKLLKKKMQCLLRVNFGKAYPTRYFWEASAKHDLNMSRWDLFKVGLDDTCEAICGSKQPVGLELFGDDLTDQLKTVKESNKSR